MDLILAVRQAKRHTAFSSTTKPYVLIRKSRRLCADKDSKNPSTTSMPQTCFNTFRCLQKNLPERHCSISSVKGRISVPLYSKSWEMSYNVSYGTECKSVIGSSQLDCAYLCQRCLEEGKKPK